jgi:hypothetical protein
MRTLVFMLVSLAACSVGNAEVLTGVVFQENGKPAPGATVTAAAVFKSPPRRRMIEVPSKLTCLR